MAMHDAPSPPSREPSISAIDKLHCAERELTFRYRVYPRLVAQGRMTRRTMNREIALMEAIAADMRKQTEAEVLP